MKVGSVSAKMAMARAVKASAVSTAITTTNFFARGRQCRHEQHFFFFGASGILSNLGSGLGVRDYSSTSNSEYG